MFICYCLCSILDSSHTLVGFNCFIFEYVIHYYDSKSQSYKQRYSRKSVTPSSSLPPCSHSPHHPFPTHSPQVVSLFSFQLIFSIFVIQISRNIYIFYYPFLYEEQHIMNLFYILLFFFSLNSISWKSLHSISQRSFSFIFIAAQYSIIWMYHSLFSPPPMYAISSISQLQIMLP